MLGPSVFVLSTVASTVISALALRSATDRGFAWVAAAITSLEALLLAFFLLAFVLPAVLSGPLADILLVD